MKLPNLEIFKLFWILCSALENISDFTIHIFHSFNILERGFSALLQETCMDGQGASGKTQTEEQSLQNMGKMGMPLGRNVGMFSEDAGMCRGRLRSAWN